MNHDQNGLLLVVSGPAGVGKGTINKILLERNPGMKMSVSATTRKPRPGEIEGIHYFFRSEDAFRRMIDQDAFLEYMQVFQSHYYGTPRSFVEEELQHGTDVILEIDVQGAMKVKKAYPDAVLIFVAPPSMSTLKSRLIGRGTETVEAIEKRFATARQEVAMISHYDYVVVNDILEAAVDKVESIITAERCRGVRNDQLIQKLMGGND